MIFFHPLSAAFKRFVTLKMLEKAEKVKFNASRSFSHLKHVHKAFPQRKTCTFLVLEKNYRVCSLFFFRHLVNVQMNSSSSGVHNFLNPRFCTHSWMQINLLLPFWLFILPFLFIFDVNWMVLSALLGFENFKRQQQFFWRTFSFASRIIRLHANCWQFLN